MARADRFPRLVDEEFHPVEFLQKVVRKLDVRLVDLINQKDHLAPGLERLPKLALADVIGDVMHPFVAKLAVAQAADGIVFVKPLLRLGGGFHMPFHDRQPQRARDLPRKLRLAGAGFALDQKRTFQRDGRVHRDCQVIGGDIGFGSAKFHGRDNTLGNGIAGLVPAPSICRKNVLGLVTTPPAWDMGAPVRCRTMFNNVEPNAGRQKEADMKPEVFLPDDYRPAEDEPFMNERQLEYFRRKLQVWKEELLEQSAETLEGLQDSARNVPDIADRASEETDRALELRTRDRQRKLVSKIDAALRRIESGEYGYCEMTGEPISLKRLNARPIATMTLEAQERHERRERVHRDD